MSYVHDVEYFAGLIDGEGHIGLHLYSNRRRPVIQLVMTHKPTVEAFAKRFKLTCRERKAPSCIKDQVEKGHSPTFVARGECHIAYDIIKQLQPFLLTKKDDADKVCQYYEGRTCARCGTPIPVSRDAHAIYCSGKCQRKVYREKNGDKLRENEKRYKKEAREKKKAEKSDPSLQSLELSVLD